ncbi:anti-sigma factor domain-containing protein [Egicoccus sp. AB-alg2]|uniref:anti-sigma factor domain-containing protein n=1 Tax=Egicoccus sp. AB-alg2 TaxID=3242693 RepID=UPI00359EACEB
MRGEHERYEQLAVGHVLGGLDAGEAADFRTHLLGCRDCRLRVAELRDLAADLAAAERDERARSQVQTEVARRHDTHEPPPTGGRIGVRHVTIASIVVILLASAMAFWNLHLRTAAASYSQAAGYRGETLRQLSSGLPVVAEAAEGVSAFVVIDGDEVAFTVSGLPELAAGERLEVWLLDEERAIRAGPPVAAASVADGALAGHVDDRDADLLVITRERGPLNPEPGGTELVRVELGAPA